MTFVQMVPGRGRHAAPLVALGAQAGQALLEPIAQRQVFAPLRGGVQAEPADAAARRSPPARERGLCLEDPFTCSPYLMSNVRMLTYAAVGVMNIGPRQQAVIDRNSSASAAR